MSDPLGLGQELSLSLQVDFVHTPLFIAIKPVPEGAQSAFTLQETDHNSISYARDEADHLTN